MDPLTAIGASLVAPAVGGLVEAFTPKERVPYYRFGSARGLGGLYAQPEEPGSPFLGNMLNAVAGTIPGIISGQYAWTSPHAGTEIESAYQPQPSLASSIQPGAYYWTPPAGHGQVPPPQYGFGYGGV